MNKLVIALALFGLGAAGTAGTTGTLNESVSNADVAFPKGDVKKKISMGVSAPSFRYFLLDSVKESDADLKTTNDSGVSLITASDLSSDAHTGFRSLKMADETSLGIRFGYTAISGYTFSFWAKKTADGASSTKFSARMDNYSTSDDASRAYYLKMAAGETVDNWTYYSCSFDRMLSGRPSMSLTVYGNWLIDDITLTDKNGINYIMDGDFEDTEMLDYKLENAGIAKQSDGSVIIGFASYNFEYNAGKSDGYNEAYFQINPTDGADSLTVSFEYCGYQVGIVNRNGYETQIEKRTSNDGTWQKFSKTLSKNPVLSAQAVYFGYANLGKSHITYVKNISFQDPDGNELLPEQLTKEGYAQGLAKTITDSVTCDGGVTAPSTKVWGDIGYCFERIPAASQEYIKSLTPKEEGTYIEKALYKYSYIISKYGTAYKDFLGYAETSKLLSIQKSAIKTLDENKNALYASLAAFGVALIVSACFICKKKKDARS